MKPKKNSGFLPFILCSLATANAADYTRLGNPDNLNTTGAWNPTPPAALTASDTALWGASSTLANTAGGALTFGTLNVTNASGPVSITSTNTSCTFNNITLGANNLTLSTGNAAISGNGSISGSGTLQINTALATSAGFVAFTNLNLTGRLELRGGNASSAPGTMSGNYYIFNSATLTQTAGTRFALDTGAAANNARDFGVTTTNLPTVSLSALSGFGAIRSDAGNARTTTYDIDQTTDTTFNGMFLSHTSGTGAVRKLALVKGGSGKLTMAGIVGKGTASAGGAASDVDITVDGGTLELTANNTRTGTTTIGASGTLTVGGAGVLGGSGTYAGTIANSGTLNLNSSATNTLSGPINNSGTLNIASIANQTLSGVLTGAGALNKSGGGALSFTGSSPLYSGNIDLTEGSIRIGPNLGTGTLTVRGGTFITMGLAATAGTSAVGALTLEPNSQSDYRLGTTNDRITVAGALTPPASDTHTINLAGTATSGGTIKLIDYTGTPLTTTEFERFVLGAPPGGIATFELINNTSDTSIDLLITLENQIWKGTTTDGNWIDDNTTANWVMASTPGSPVAFNGNHPSVFDDTAAIFAVVVDPTLGVNPTKVTFNNSANAYTLTGGEITGASGLFKDGINTTRLSQANSYTGGTIVNAGTLVFDGAVNNSSGGTIINGGTLRIGSGGTTGDIGSGAVSVAMGAVLEFNRSNAAPGTPDLNYKTTPKLRNVSGAGDIVLTGGVHLFNYTGTGTGFNESGSWAGFSGNLTVKGGSEFMTIRNGATAMGTGDVILGDATTSGALSPIEGNWTWTNDIILVGSNNVIRNRAADGPRTLKLQGVISGSGGILFDDTTDTMTNLQTGFILTGTNTLDGTLTINTGTPVRVGGVPGEIDVSQSGAGTGGTLGAATVVNNGTLTFSRSDAHTVDNDISGSGSMVVGLAAGNTAQVMTYTGAASHAGTTTITAGTLLVGPGGSLGGSSVTVASGATIGGTGTVAAPLTVDGTVAPGTSIGTLPVTDNTAVNGTLAIEVDGASVDKISVTGDLTLNGALTLTETGAGFTAASYVVAECTGTLSGTLTAPPGYTVTISGSQVILEEAAGYDAWAATNAGGQTANLDFDNDGVSNGVEYFMGETGSSFTPNPTVVTTGAVRTVTWPRDPAAIASFKIQISTTLAPGGWTDVIPPHASIDTSNPNQVTYTLPAGTIQFCRLVVTP